MFGMCFYANESFYDQELGGYIIAKVTRDAPGYEVSAVGAFATPELAKEKADLLNENMGLTEEDVLDIVVSSMRLGPVK